MRRIYIYLGANTLLVILCLTLAKPVGEENDDNKLHCVDSNEKYEKNYAPAFSDYYKPRQKFDGVEKFPSEYAVGYDKKRSVSSLFSSVNSRPLQKRQLGVIYKDDNPIGILQPYQRTYRFLPIRDDDLYGSHDVSYNSVSGNIEKREADVSDVDSSQYLGDNYPSILTNFKIVNKLDKKRNYNTLTNDNVRDLKSTIRRLRSSNSGNSEQIEEELKNILDDMGLIEESEAHAEKRETAEDDKFAEDDIKSMKDVNKRDEDCSNDNNDVSDKLHSEHKLVTADGKVNDLGYNAPQSLVDKGKGSDVINRQKRQKQESMMKKEGSELVENIKDSGDIMLSGNKSPLASSSEITGDTSSNGFSEKSEEDDYDNRVERQIQTKINSLKEQVKREIEALEKKDDDGDEDTQRNKRQITENLIDEESDELDPAMNAEPDIKSLIRKRRTADGLSSKTLSNNITMVRKKRQTATLFDDRLSNSRNQKKYRTQNEDKYDDVGDLLGDDNFADQILKRQIYHKNQNYNSLVQDSNLKDRSYERNKRSQSLPSLYFYDYDDNERLKRQNDDNMFDPKLGNQNFIRPRNRRRITENQIMLNRPQQLSDMSDLDIFGALPKSYTGELSRYKRIK